MDQDDAAAPPVPEVQVKLLDLLPLQGTSADCRGRVPIRIWIQDPSGKRSLDARLARLAHLGVSENPGDAEIEAPGLALGRLVLRRTSVWRCVPPCCRED